MAEASTHAKRWGTVGVDIETRWYARPSIYQPPPTVRDYYLYNMHVYSWMPWLSLVLQCVTLGLLVLVMASLEMMMALTHDNNNNNNDDDDGEPTVQDVTYAVHIFEGGRIITLGAGKRLPTKDDEVHRIITQASETYVTHHGPRAVVDDTRDDKPIQRITYCGYVHDDDGLDKEQLENELAEYDPDLVDVTNGADACRIHTALGITLAQHILQLTPSCPLTSPHPSSPSESATEETNTTDTS